jgi:tetratricopeptide (TPR) repeat protein
VISQRSLSVLGLILLGCTGLLRAQDDQVQSQAEADVVDNDTSPYHLALIDYKAGKFQAAYDTLSPEVKAGLDPANPIAAQRIAILDSKILTELKRYDEGEKVLRSVWTPNGPVEIQLALGDLLLRKHSFDRAAKYYTLALQTKPNDSDITLKIVYCLVGTCNLLDAGKYASQLKPFDPAVDPLDPKHPGNPSYYFAQAALAEATGKTADAQEDIENARTLYGNIMTDRYLKTYLDVFSTKNTTPNSDITPPPLVTPAPTGIKQ